MCQSMTTSSVVEARTADRRSTASVWSILENDRSLSIDATIQFQRHGFKPKSRGCTTAVPSVRVVRPAPPSRPVHGPLHAPGPRMRRPDGREQWHEYFNLRRCLSTRQESIPVIRPCRMPTTPRADSRRFQRTIRGRRVSCRISGRNTVGDQLESDATRAGVGTSRTDHESPHRRTGGRRWIDRPATNPADHGPDHALLGTRCVGLELDRLIKKRDTALAVAVFREERRERFVFKARSLGSVSCVSSGF